MEVLKISSKSRPKSAAGAIAAELRSAGCVDVQAIGAGAVNQAVKSIAIANAYIVEDDLALACVPEFTKIDVDGEDKTAIRFIVTSYHEERGAEEEGDL